MESAPGDLLSRRLACAHYSVDDSDFHFLSSFCVCMTQLIVQGMRRYASKQWHTGVQWERFKIQPARLGAEFQQIAARTLDAALSERELEAFVQLLKEVVKARGGFTAVARKTA
jgi:hypothetical protein